MEEQQQQQQLLLQYASTGAASAQSPNDTDARIQDWAADTQSRAEQAGQEERGQAGEDVGEEANLHSGLLEMQRLLGLEAAGEEGGGDDNDDDDGDGDTSSRSVNGKRKRQRPETATRTDSSAAAAGKPRRRRTIKQPSLQYAACVPPRLDDFNRGFASLNPTMWTWVAAEEGEESARKRRRPEGGPPLRARMPTVPSWGLSTRVPLAREENNLERHLRAAAAAGSSKATKKALTMMARFRRGGDDGPRRPSPFFAMPQEVRDAVYRNLLVSGRPVPVHDGWRSVLRLRGRAKDAGPGLGLQPAVLRVCYRSYVEGVRVLYGDNTFLYRLRDPLAKMAPPVADVPRLAYGGGGGEGDEEEGGGGGEPMDITGSDDEEGKDDDDDSGSEYEDESEARARKVPKQRGGRKRHAEQDDDDDDGAGQEAASKDGRACINVARFYHLFRYIAIEAESNRCSNERLEHMVRAINVWTSPPKLPSHDFLARHVRAAAAKGGDHSPARAAPPAGGKKPAGKKPNAAAASRRKSKKEKDEEAEEEKEEGERLAPPANIYSLAIRFSPMRTRDSFTFVDFFGPESPLTEALKRLETQFLYVVIKTQHLIFSPHEQEFSAATLTQQQRQRRRRRQGEDGTARTHGSRFVVNLRLHRLRRRVNSGSQADPWADDAGLTARARAEGAAQSLGVIDGLGESVEGCCRRWVEQNGIGLLEDEWWDEYDDQFDDDGDGSWGG